MTASQWQQRWHVSPAYQQSQVFHSYGSRTAKK